jgi:hypothetical protein
MVEDLTSDSILGQRRNDWGILWIRVTAWAGPSASDGNLQPQLCGYSMPSRAENKGVGQLEKER